MYHQNPVGNIFMILQSVPDVFHFVYLITRGPVPALALN